jgi:hypothetical protein
MIKKVYGFNTAGEPRLRRVYAPSVADEEIVREVLATSEGNIVDYRETIVFGRFNNLYIAFVVENENEMHMLALINNLMSIYDKLFTKVCELHFIYNFRETHIVLDNYISNGKCIENEAIEVVKHVYATKQ